MLFFFQAEDGIRDWSATGVQTCALPIWGRGRYVQIAANLMAVGRVAIEVAQGQWLDAPGIVAAHLQGFPVWRPICVRHGDRGGACLETLEFDLARFESVADLFDGGDRLADANVKRPGREGFE